MPQNDYAPGASLAIAVNKGSFVVNNFLYGDIKAQNVQSDFVLNNNLLTLNNLSGNAFNGKFSGNAKYNIPYQRTEAQVNGTSMDANSVFTTFSGLATQLYGTLSFNANANLAGSTYKQQMQTLKGTASFNVADGQMGDLGKFEHFLYAQNIITSKFFNININSILKTLSPKNTGKFSYLKGSLSFKNGYAYLSPISSSGPNMSLYVEGTYNLLNNYANAEILGRISKDVQSCLGTMGEVTLSNILSNMGKFGSVTSGIMQNYNVQTSKAQLAKIPVLTPQSNESKEFVVKVNGDIQKVASVKSFKWLTTEKVNLAEVTQSKTINKVQNAATNVVQQTSQTTTSTQPKQQTVDIPDFLKVLPNEIKNTKTIE